MSREERLLFYGQDLGEVLRERQRQALAEIDGLDPDRLLGMVGEDLVDYIADKFGFEALSLSEDEVEASVVDTKKDIRWDLGRDIRDRSRPFYVPATLAELHIPFTGESELFGCQASHYTLNPPRGAVGTREITVSVDASGQDSTSVRAALDRMLSSIREHIAWTNADVEKHNDQLRQVASARIEARKKKLLADRGLEEALGFPIRARDGQQPIPAVPLRRKRLSAPLPPAVKGGFRPEPQLADKHYEDILRVMSNMVDVMERSPHAFRAMGEEDLRQHFLVQLNGQYEGDATGETFNFEGKTDIFIRHNGGAVFVAECKIWRGPKDFTAAVDQLLNYVTWRDTKTALLVFNRNKNMTAVLKKVKEALAAHPHSKRFESYPSETGFRCRLSHKSDPAREMVLTVMVFDVPGDAPQHGDDQE